MKKKGRYGDGHGLWLQVSPTGSKSWCFVYRRGATQHVMGLGPLYAVSLAEARVRARQANQCLADGGDPIAIKRADEQARKIEALRTTTFFQAAEQFMATDAVQRLSNDRHRKQWRTTIEEACKTIGALPLEEIDSAIMFKTLLPIWQRAPETGSRLRGRLEGCLPGRSRTNSIAGANPAFARRAARCPAGQAAAEHLAAIPYSDMPAFMADLRPAGRRQPRRSNSDPAESGPQRRWAPRGARSTWTRRLGWSRPRG